MATTMDFVLGQVKSNLAEFTHQFKKAYSEEGMYHPMESVDWTTGFWTGQVWLAYEWAKRVGNKVEAEVLETAGRIQIKNFLEWIEKGIEMDHHDMEFLYFLSCMAGLKLVGSEEGKEAAIRAADQLISRFYPVGRFIRAWGPMDRPEDYRFIIDRLSNLPPLHWASEETGDEKYREIAGKHLRITAIGVIREDYPTWHTFFVSMETGAPDHGATCRGYRDGSVWVRGQAWGVYDMVLAYRYANQKEYIKDSKHVTGHLLEYLPEDLVPYWDSEFGDGSGEPRDPSSASIAVCGMLEMTRYLKGDDAAYCTGIAKKLMKSMVDSYAAKDQTESNGLVPHSIYSKKSPYNICMPEGVDECNIWEGYFYMEVLMRLAGDWNPY